MAAEPELAGGFSQIFYYLGIAAAGIGVGIAAYFKKPAAAPSVNAAVVGALVDNSVVDPLIEALDRLTAAMDRSHRRETEQEREQELREKLDQERRMVELLERLERATVASRNK